MKISRCTPAGDVNNIDAQMYYRVNCFEVTGNLIIVIECKIGAFFKKK